MESEISDLESESSEQSIEFNSNTISSDLKKFSRKSNRLCAKEKVFYGEFVEESTLELRTSTYVEIQSFENNGSCVVNDEQLGVYCTKDIQPYTQICYYCNDYESRIDSKKELNKILKDNTKIMKVDNKNVWWNGNKSKTVGPYINHACICVSNTFIFFDEKNKDIAIVISKDKEVIKANTEITFDYGYLKSVIREENDSNMKWFLDYNCPNINCPKETSNNKSSSKNILPTQNSLQYSKSNILSSSEFIKDDVKKFEELFGIKNNMWESTINMFNDSNTWNFDSTNIVHYFKDIRKVKLCSFENKPINVGLKLNNESYTDYINKLPQLLKEDYILFSYMFFHTTINS